MAFTKKQAASVTTVPEQHYTPEELGRAWHLSANTIRGLFQNEPGVLLITRPERMHTRGYQTMRIPASVAERVHEQMRVKRVG